MSRLKVFVEWIYTIIRLFMTDLVEAVKAGLLPPCSVKRKKLITKTRVCVLAVYQERELREDIKILITTLVDLNCDLMAVNTNKIEDFSENFLAKSHI